MLKNINLILVINMYKTHELDFMMAATENDTHPCCLLMQRFCDHHLQVANRYAVAILVLVGSGVAIWWVGLKSTGGSLLKPMMEMGI
ncbi:hypothetical protein [Pedobacter terrae]|uniref:hypothetical protein n=1 Tax=Pedobacter terrae TaxID=405671 RepID=UPI002FFCA974